MLTLLDRLVAQGLTDDTGRVFDRPWRLACRCRLGGAGPVYWPPYGTQQELKDLKERFKNTTPAVGPEQLWGAVREC